MNWEAIGAVAEILGALAVVGSLLYLAVQIRHGASATQAASRYATAQLTTDVLVPIASDAELASILRRGQIDPDSLSDDEGFRFDVLLYSIFDQWETMYSQVLRGAMSEEDWEKYDRSIIGIYLAQPGTQRFWETAADMYSTSFREYIDQVSSKKHRMWRDDDDNLQVS
jgi:hypothetical protein